MQAGSGKAAAEAIPAEADNESRNYRADAEQGGQMLIKIITTLRDGKGKPKELDNICGQQVMHIEGI